MAKIADSPCFGCGQKYLGCHSHCEAYKGYNIRQEAKRAEHMREADIDHGSAETVRKWVKHRTNKWGGEG